MINFILLLLLLLLLLNFILSIFLLSGSYLKSPQPANRALQSADAGHLIYYDSNDIERKDLSIQTKKCTLNSQYPVAGAPETSQGGAGNAKVSSEIPLHLQLTQAWSQESNSE